MRNNRHFYTAEASGDFLAFNVKSV